MKGLESRAFQNLGAVICEECEEKYIGGCELTFDTNGGKLPISDSSVWSQDDEDEWQSLLATEPASKQGYLPIGEQELITLQRNNIPQGDKAQTRGVQFLKPLHVTNPKGMSAKIYKVTTDKPDNFGNPVTVYFNIGGAKYSKGFKFTSDNLASLVDLLGAEESKWIGKSITIGKLVDDDGGERLVFAK